MHLRLARKYSKKRLLAYVPYYAKDTIYIQPSLAWFEALGDGTLEETACAILSHESLHVVLNKINLRASAKIDGIFNIARDWNQFKDGLANPIRRAFGND